MNFASLNLSPALLRALDHAGLVQPSPIQTEAIPAVLQGRDVWATAPTGSGKTLAYAVSVVQQQVLRPRQTNFRRPVRSLVLVPTRELAVQVGAVFAPLAQAAALKLAVVYGGVSINPQMMALRGGADIVIATPGRLLDLIDHNALRLDDVQHLVLDEADRLLDTGFADEWQRIASRLPTQRQTLLFSATDAGPIQTLASEVLQTPLRIQAEAMQWPEPEIHHRAIAVDEARRIAVLRHLIATLGASRVLVFVATRYACEHVARRLEQAGFTAAAFHGEMAQGTRQQTLDAFKAGQVAVLVTTDLAARGIDIAHLPVVVNFDLPRSATDYTHRVGRTGRAGARGEALSLVTARMQPHWRLIQKRAQIEVPPEVLPGFEPTEVAPPAAGPNDGNGGIKGKRPSKKDKLRAAAAAAQASEPGQR